MGCLHSKPDGMISEEESVKDFLSSNPFFKNLSQQQLGVAASKFTVKKFEAGKRIITQGDIEDSLYCVAFGAVDFIAEGEDHRTKKIRTMGRHEFFGEFGLIHNTPRTVSVDAVTDVVLLSLTRENYERALGETWIKNLQRWVNATASSIVASGLKEIPFLRNVNERQLNVIGRLFRCEVLPAGSVIEREGEIGDRFYILSRGQLVLTTRDELGLYVELTRLQPGSTFGELSLLKDQPRNSTITSLDECVLFSLGREEFGYFMKSLPSLGEEVEKSVNERATVNVIAERIPVFRSMSKRKQHLLAEVCTMQRHNKGEVILEEGGMLPRKFFIITRGTVEVFIGKEKVRTMGLGAYFGEVGLVSESPHSATVKVSDAEDAYMLECSQDDFRQLFVGEPSVLAEISLRVLGTRATFEDVLRHPLSREYFSMHVEKEFAKENIEFWNAVENLESISRRRVRKSVIGALKVSAKDVTASKKRMLATQASDIYDTFVAPKAPKQVNLPDPIVKKIKSQIEQDKLDFKMFAEAKSEVLALMSKDSFARFQSSASYAELLNRIGVYEQKRPSFVEKK
mmetsp:Transcript_17663/g.32526  ORF Transcript_17663/g.32526 Transcript_17663/m.32526 type:complete len:570 (+) Transcript_17663:415-2124(+)